MQTPATITNESVLTKRQRAKFGPVRIDYFGTPATITAEVRYDDDCGNGHNSFAITAAIRKPGTTGDRGWLAGGCCHDEIAKAFPELAPLIKWHLCSSDGPMHYIANTTHFASDRDCWGFAKGEANAWEYGIRFDGVPITHRVKKSFFEFIRDRHDPTHQTTFQVVAFAHEHRPGGHKYADHYSFAGFGNKWHEAPFRDKAEAEQFAAALNTCRVEFVRDVTGYSEGKARELNHARSAAVWPEATDEELTSPDLKERLEARLPALLADFRAAVESLGFIW